MFNLFQNAGMRYARLRNIKKNREKAFNHKFLKYLKFLKFLKFLLKVGIHVSLVYNRYLTPRPDTLSPKQRWVRVDFVSNGTENDEDMNGGTRTTVGPNRVLK